MRDGLTAEQAAQAVAVPRASLYRWEKQVEPRAKRPHRVRKPAWTPALVTAVEHRRLDHPMWGRAKLSPLLRREGFVGCDATVGRIIAHLVARGVVEPVPSLRRRKGSAARTWRRKHAARLPKGHKATKPGERVQVDTLSINVRPDRSITHFTAYDPVARFTAAKAFSTATARCAASVLDTIIAELPFPVTGIQVDGGSAFMAAFERACADKNLPLFGLPPRRPDLNGAPERAQSSWRYEFYACHDLPHRLDPLNQRIDDFAHLHNHHRPYGALGAPTPAQYLPALSSGTPASHVR